MWLGEPTEGKRHVRESSREEMQCYGNINFRKPWALGTISFLWNDLSFGRGEDWEDDFIRSKDHLQKYRVITSLHRKCSFLRELTAQILASLRNQATSGLKVTEEIRTQGADGASKLFPLLCSYHIFYQRGRPSGQRSCPSYHLTGHSWGHTFPGHNWDTANGSQAVAFLLP